jgi:hypothetical protein
MSLFSKPVPFEEAADYAARKVALPSTLSSAELRALGPDLFRRALVSARVDNAKILGALQSQIDAALNDAGNLPEARLAIQRALAEAGYQAPEGKEGTISDLATRKRQDLMLRTNLDTARGFGQALISNDADLLDGFPAWELVRDEQRDVPRGSDEKSLGWERRWLQAAQASGDGRAGAALANNGRMVALKSSPIWGMLGSLWEDSLGNPYPPFAFNSGMGVEEVDREDAESLGLLTRGQEVAAAKLPGVNENFELELPAVSRGLLDALLESFGADVTVANNVLRLRA